MRNNRLARPTRIGRLTGGSASAPTVVSAGTNYAGNNFSVTLDRAVTGYTGFSITAPSGRTLTYAAGDGTTELIFTVSPAIQYGETITLSYTPGDVESASGGVPLVAFSGLPATNYNSFPGWNANTQMYSDVAGTTLATNGQGVANAVVPGYGWSVIQSTSGKRPTLNTHSGSYSSLDFVQANSTKLESSGNFGITGEYTLFCKFKSTGTNTGYNRLLDTSYATGFWFGHYAGAGNGTNTWGSGGLGVVNGLYVTIDATSAPVWIIVTRDNAGLVTMLASNSDTDSLTIAGALTDAPLCVGTSSIAAPADLDHFNGEILIFGALPYKVSAECQTAIQAYLNA